MARRLSSRDGTQPAIGGGGDGLPDADQPVPGAPEAQDSQVPAVGAAAGTPGDENQAAAGDTVEALPAELSALEQADGRVALMLGGEVLAPEEATVRVVPVLFVPGEADAAPAFVVMLVPGDGQSAAEPRLATIRAPGVSPREMDRLIFRVLEATDAQGRSLPLWRNLWGLRALRWRGAAPFLRVADHEGQLPDAADLADTARATHLVQDARRRAATPAGAT